MVELNVRMTMGRVALALMAKSRPGRTCQLSIKRKNRVSTEEIGSFQQGTLEGGSILLNDPTKAREFLVVWEVG